MRKISFILALVFILGCLPSCSTKLEPAIEEAKETVSEEAENKKEPAKKETKKEEESIMQTYDPKEDETINVLMIGSSFCYYYVEELYGIAKAAGVDMKVCNVYYSGCKLQQHWTWWKQNESHYQYFETDDKGRIKVADPTNLDFCLKRENWDIISFQQSSSLVRGDMQASKDSSYKYLEDLLEYVKGQFPKSTYLWHQTWSYQIGYDRSGVVVDTAEKQAELYGYMRDFSLEVCRDFDLIRVPSGDAWQYARKDSRVGDVLCNRGDKSDNYHDGDEGGGQYLNACVWFEIITGQSCIGNTWRPTDYTLSEEKIAGLQEAAHRAAAESRG